MDIVPANQRGRWAALESINGAMWSGNGGIHVLHWFSKKNNIAFDMHC